MNATHKIKWQGKGSDVWAECHCGCGYVWLGRYFLGKSPKRRAAAREAFDKLTAHLERVAADA